MAKGAASEGHARTFACKGSRVQCSLPLASASESESKSKSKYDGVAHLTKATVSFTCSCTGTEVAARRLRKLHELSESGELDLCWVIETIQTPYIDRFNPSIITKLRDQLCICACTARL